MVNKQKCFVSSVIYVHNAEKRISDFLEVIIGAMEANFEHSEIICVNDCSDDRSLDVIRDCSSIAKTTNITVINLSYFHGLEFAMNAGIDIAIGDFVFEFDTTFIDYDPQEIISVFMHSLEGFDIVSASPERKERFSSALFYWVFERYSNNRYKLSTESFRVLSRRLINRVKSMNRAVPYRKALYVNSGFKTDVYKYKVVGSHNNKMDKREKAYRSGLAVDILLLFTELGYSFAKYMTIAMMILSILMLGYSILTYFMANPVEGWTTTVLFLSISFFGLFGILTIVIKYLQLIVNLIFKRSHYVYESIEKLTE